MSRPAWTRWGWSVLILISTISLAAKDVVEITPNGPISWRPPRRIDEVLVYIGQPDRPHRVIASGYYDATRDGILTNASMAIAAIRKRAAEMGADCLMEVTEERNLGPFNESTARAKLCVFTYDTKHEDGQQRTGPASLSPAPGLSHRFRQGSPQRNAFALIIGVERYRDVPAATGARQDAQRFVQIARTTLGISESNIKLMLDERAARSDIDKALAWSRTNVPPGGRIYFFFSGHGAPEPSSGTSYLVPYDGDPAQLDQSALRISQLLKTLGSTKAKETLVLLDTCFSGLGGRSILAPGTRPLVLVRAPVPASHVALLSAASGSEVSGPAPGNSGGLFSAVLTEGLGDGHADLNNDGSISLDELFQWIRPRVAQQAQRDNRVQTPSLLLAGKTKATDFVVASGLSAQ